MWNEVIRNSQASNAHFATGRRAAPGIEPGTSRTLSKIIPLDQAAMQCNFSAMDLDSDNFTEPLLLTSVSRRAGKLQIVAATK